MSKEITADYSQKFLLPPSIEDWVPPDHPVRFIRLFVESLHLSDLGFKARKSEEGRPNYSNELLLKIWLYGYFTKRRSSRELERSCRSEMPLIWLSGMNYPDHNTLWRFFRNNRLSIKNVFKQTVKLAVKNDMIGFALQAVDGTKVMADVCKRRSLHRADINRLILSLDESLEEVLSGIESREELESGLPEYNLPLELQDKEKLRELIKNGLDESTTEDKVSLRSSLNTCLEQFDSEETNHLNLTDEESRLMKGGSIKTSEFSYNAQSIVDGKDQLIVGAKVSQSVTDNHLLTEMIDESKENTGRLPEETVADAGYFSGEELHESEEKGHSVLVNLSSNVGKSQFKKSDRFFKDKFKFDKSNDQYECPLGKVLIYERTKRRKDRHYSIRVYRCKGFRECPYRDECSKDKNGRTIERSPYEDVIKKQRDRQKNPQNKKLLSKRKAIVEPVFGWIKHNLGFRRWSYRGLESVDAQWNMICVSVNLKKLYKKWRAEGLSFNIS